MATRLSVAPGDLQCDRCGQWVREFNAGKYQRCYGAAPLPLTLVWRNRSLRISGTVTNATGAGIANAAVSYSGGSTTATTIFSGAYTLSVAPGTYSVTAAASGYVSSTPQNFSVIAGSTTVANFSLAASAELRWPYSSRLISSQSGLTSLSLAFPVTPTAGNTLIVVGISSGVLGNQLDGFGHSFAVSVWLRDEPEHERAR